ncbi:NAD(P)/FAD-dependent oxidoreductase [Leucobacter chinensis]|uniref:NAD(P)/FAD-dependent oxidoreductase n=1 Tax=Leucobacter chinensis TaxID=2851010 RepID=UPI001C23B372
MQQTVFERQRPAAKIVEDALRDTKLSCFWIDDVKPQTTRYPVLGGDLSAEYVVVGAGYAGLWTAIKLKEERPDARVVVLEARRVGWAASGRNGGFCEASITHGEANAEARWPDHTEQLRQAGHENLDAMERFITEHKLDVDWERTGQLSVANEDHQTQWLGEDPNPGVVTLSASETQERIASPTFIGSDFDATGCAIVHPMKLALELARHARELGVEIYEESRVTKLDGKTDGPVTLHTHLGTVTAQRVALCTNVFPSLLKRYRWHTVPVYDYVLMTEPLTDEQLESIGWKGREGLADMANQFHYSRLTADNRILWGGYDAVYFAGAKIKSEYEDRLESHEKLARHFFTTFPQLAGVKFTHRWAGVIDTSTRFCAFFGQALGGRVQYVAGFTGLGVGATHFAADVVVDRLHGRITERTELPMVREVPLPFPPEPAASMGIQFTRWSLNQADHREGKRNPLLKTLDALGLGFDS